MSKQILLGVNVDHVATIRQARGSSYPDPVEAALLAEQAGADYITMHLREDRRHIQVDDVMRLCQIQRTYLNLEVAVIAEMLDFALEVAPRDCCLVPERRQELTTEGGLNVKENQKSISDAITALEKINTRVSLFIDADKTQIQAAADCGAKVVEFHTGHYADAAAENKQTMVKHLRECFEFANSLNLLVNAGHGLTLDNVSRIAKLPHLQELNIGHSIVSRALMVGFKRAVEEIKAAIKRSV